MHLITFLAKGDGDYLVFDTWTLIIVYGVMALVAGLILAIFLLPLIELTKRALAKRKHKN